MCLFLSADLPRSGILDQLISDFSALRPRMTIPVRGNGWDSQHASVARRVSFAGAMKAKPRPHAPFPLRALNGTLLCLTVSRRPRLSGCYAGFTVTLVTRCSQCGAATCVVIPSECFSAPLPRVLVRTFLGCFAVLSTLTRSLPLGSPSGAVMLHSLSRPFSRSCIRQLLVCKPLFCNPVNPVHPVQFFL